MNTHVPTIESGEDMTTPIEDSLSSHPGTPENSDVALFKQKIEHSKSALYEGILTSDLETDSEQTKVLENLSHKFKSLLGSEAQDENSLHASSQISKNSPLSHKESANKMGVHADSLIQKGVRDDKFVNFTNVVKEKNHTAKTDLHKAVPDLTQDGTTLPIAHVPLVSETGTIQNSGHIETHAVMISQQIKEQVINRILVSANDIAADKTVKVILNPTVLEGTEVNFQKVGNVLSVQFASRNEGSLQFLQANQADLQGYLQGELKQFKGVSVTVKSSGNSAEHPEDGRSRNRYEYQTLDEDEQ